MIRCRFCGKAPAECYVTTTVTAPSGILLNDGIADCEYNERHVFVHKEHSAYKEHPFVQYASELDFRVRSCPDCMELTRYGATPKGRWEWFSRDTLRQHWRECKGGQHDRDVPALREGMEAAEPGGTAVHRAPGAGRAPV